VTTDVPPDICCFAPLVAGVWGQRLTAHWLMSRYGIAEAMPWHEPTTRSTNR